MILIKIITMSLMCAGAFIAIDTLLWTFFGMNRDDLSEKLPKWATIAFKPIAFCIYCASTFWGLIAYALMPEPSIHEGFVCWIACVAANTYLSEKLDI